MTRMRQVTSAAAVAFGLLVGAAGAAPAGAERPNVVVIMTDDQDFRSMPALPKTRDLIGDRGTTFAASTVNFPLCCPSRATFLTGQYAHNHGVRWNTFPEGGYYRFRQRETLPVWLQRAGYRTIHVGKYLNQTGERDPREIPKGWTDWHGGVDPTTYDYYGYTLNHNGKLRTYGRTPADYSTDVYADLAVTAIRDARRSGKPFFLEVAPNAPHTVSASSNAEIEGTPALPPPRYASRYAAAALPSWPNFNEADVSDKPLALRETFPNRLTGEEIAALTEHYRGRMGALLGVDDLVERVVRQLRRSGVYDNTVIVFTSDNGWILGEHRLRDPVTSNGRAAGVKFVPYEGSSRVPLLISGPGFPRGRVVRAPVTNADLAGTIAELGQARPRLPQDGISLLPVARDPARFAARSVLIQAFDNPRRVSPYASIRTQRYRYDVEASGSDGLYDLRRDPWELHSVAGDARYAAIKRRLVAALGRLRACRGKACSVDVADLPEPSRRPPGLKGG